MWRFVMERQGMTGAIGHHASAWAFGVAKDAYSGKRPDALRPPNETR